MQPDYVIEILQGCEPLDPVTDNVDVEVRFPDGRRYSATYFTLENIALLMERYRATGECKDGLYLWCVDMVVIRRLTREQIASVVEDLIATGEFESAFSRLETDSQRG